MGREHVVSGTPFAVIGRWVIVVAVLACALLAGIIITQKEQPKMRKFYLSGPMRGYEKFNFPAFDAARDAGRARGFGVMSPADMDRELGHTENDVLEEINTPENQRRFAARDCAALLALKAENGDGIALLPGWEKSTGAVAELMLARWLKLTVVDATTWEPFTQEALDQLDLSPLLANTRLFIGDKNCDLYYEEFEEGK